MKTIVNRRTAIKGAVASVATLQAGKIQAKNPSQDTLFPQQHVREPAREKKLDVIIIGAGLSGLNAALLLEEIGYKVLVLEGRDRVGGRVYTLDDVPGYPESGGNEIGSTYGRLLGAMDRYGVDSMSMRPRTENTQDHTILNIQNTNINIKDWESHKANPFPEHFRKVLPWQFEFNALVDHNRLQRVEDFLDPANAKFDISVYDFLSRQGFDPRSIQLGAGTNLGHGNSPHEISVLMWFNILAFVNSSVGNGSSKSSLAAFGGNQRIPEHMAQALKGDVRLNAKVIGIRNEKEKVTAMLADGVKLSAPRMIVTAPLSALRLINLDVPLSLPQSLAVSMLDYTRVTQLHYRPLKKFWELDGLPPSMWTDGMTARLLALRNNPDAPDEITSFVVYANDRVAHHLDRLGPAAANFHIQTRLGHIRPSTKGALEFIKFWSWQLDPFAGGAYAAWQPGQISTFGSEIGKPAGRVHFAGEHTSAVTRGMEAAMESGERVAFEVADLL